MRDAVSRSFARRAGLLLFALTVAAYAAGLNGAFQFDDHGVIVRYEGVHSLGGLLAGLGGLRHLLKLSYAFCWAWGGSPTPFHVFNLLVHLANVELVLRLFTAASDRAARWPFRELRPGGVVAGVLFALHPIQTEAVQYISGRSSSLSAFFVLLALLLYTQGVRAQKRRYWLGLAPLAFIGALLSKETTAPLPLGLLLWELVVERSPWREAARRLGVWFGLVALLFAGAVMHPRYFALLYEVLGQRALAESLRYQLGGLAYLTGRLSLLKPLCIDPGLWLALPSPLLFFSSALISAAISGILLWQARARPLLLFGFGWFLLQAFLPYVVLPRVDVINERHAYLANAGLFVALGSGWTPLRERFRGAAWLRAALPTLALLLALLTHSRVLDYRTELALWRSTVRVAPRNPRAQNNLGVAYEAAHHYPQACAAYARALQLEPRYAAAAKNLTRAAQLVPHPS